MTPKLKLVGSGVAAAVMMIAGWEGLRTEAYRDIGGVPTICYGHTQGVRMGDVSDPKACRAQLTAEVQIYWDEVDSYISKPMTTGQHIAFTDLDYNVGTGLFAGSTLVKLANQGNLPGACLELLKWVKDRQSKYWPDPVPGLVKRRNFFFRICIDEGVSE